MRAPRRSFGRARFGAESTELGESGMTIGHEGTLRHISRACGWVVLAAATGLLGCNKSVSVGGAETAEGSSGRRDTRVVHEKCDIEAKSAEKIDVNGDGKPDITIVKSGGREACRGVDLNFDGAVDTWVYSDERGQVRRRESDYDRDGRIDEISIYKAGVLSEQQRATTLGGKLDTWHYFQSGKLSRTERDSDGDEIIDQWWEYPIADKPECPVIHSDVDGDGKPDPGATVDVCKQPGSGYVPPDRSGAPAPGESRSYERPKAEDVPTKEEQEKGGDQ